MDEYFVNPETKVSLSESRCVSYRELYSSMNSKLLTENQLRNFNFPMQGAAKGQAVLFNLPHKFRPTVPAEFKRTCVLCKQIYELDANNNQPTGTVCGYHLHRSLNLKTRVHSCCGQSGGSIGCNKRSFHVNEDVDPERLFNCINSSSDGLQKKKAVYALDCEFVFTKRGLDLASIVIIDHCENQVLNTRIIPLSPIVDYHTQFSGLTASDFEGGRAISHSQYVDKLKQIVGPDVILIGHGLKEDLLHMRLIHSKIVDTSALYPHKDQTKTNSLAWLWKTFFYDKLIVDSNKAHVDCKKALRLAMKKL